MSSGDESVTEIVNEVENELGLNEDGGDLEVIEDNLENVEPQADEAGVQSSQPVKPKRVVRNPIPKLNDATLRGQRGLTALEGYFQRVKFKGKGHEEQDLNVLMKTYEYWCHRLFPKYPFDACIEKLETLGTKKSVQTFIKKIRLDMVFLDEKENISDEEEVPTDGFVEPVESTDSQFDQLLAQPGCPEPEPELTEEQLQRIKQNKEKADKLRLESLKRIREKAENSLGESSRFEYENHDDNESRFDTAQGDQDNPPKKSATKKKTQVIESDDEDTHVNSKNDEYILEKLGKDQSDTNEDNIDNILTEINRDQVTELDKTAGSFDGNEEINVEDSEN